MLETSNGQPCASKSIAALITVHNRKEKTLQCLERLNKQDLPESNTVDVFLTDDGCTDGTPEAIAEKFPQVNIIRGDGNLFWNRGMYMAWQEAARAKDYDFYLWLNDDTFLFEAAINLLVGYASEVGDKSIIVASVKSASSDVVTYGGYCNGKLITPDGTLRECDTFNGNCVLVPRYVFNKLGNLDWAYRHAIGDLDYGHRAKRAGLKNYVSPVYLGICEKNHKLPAWARSEVPLCERLKNLYSPLGYAEPMPFFRYERKNLGLAVAVKHFISIHLRVLFPQLWKN